MCGVIMIQFGPSEVLKSEMTLICSSTNWLSPPDQALPSENISFHSSAAGKKGGRALLKATATLRNHYDFDKKEKKKKKGGKKIPIATDLCVFLGKEAASDFSNKTCNINMSLGEISDRRALLASRSVQNLKKLHSDLSFSYFLCGKTNKQLLIWLPALIRHIRPIRQTW